MNRFLSILVAASLLSVCSCGQKQEPDPTPSDTRVLELSLAPETVDWQGGAFTVNVNCNFEYKVDIDAVWVTYDPSKASNQSALYFTAEQNQSIAERTATIKLTDVTDRYYSKVVTVKQAANPNPALTLHMVDKNATEETKALYANLYQMGYKGFMFGHHDDLWYGRYWYNEAGRSDTKEVCGDYPAVFSVDFGAFMDKRYSSDGENSIRRRVILEARKRGEVIMAVCHQNNPQTGGDSWDNKDATVVKNILTEGNATRTEYLKWLDRLAEFAFSLKDEDGKLIPIILRIYHEHTQSWSWWGSSCTTASEFINLWQMTVKYLRDTKGVHNFIYAISPQMDGWYGADECNNRIVYRWPGDDYVDFIGMDCYHGQNPAALTQYLDALEGWADKKMKPCGITEDGIESFATTDYWSRQVMDPVKGRRVSMVVMWRNKYVGNNETDKHYYSVYPGHPSTDDFIKFYKDPETYFSKDLPKMYVLPENVVVK